MNKDSKITRFFISFFQLTLLILGFDLMSFLIVFWERQYVTSEHYGAYIINAIAGVCLVGCFCSGIVFRVHPRKYGFPAILQIVAVYIGLIISNPFHIDNITILYSFKLFINMIAHYQPQTAVHPMLLTAFVVLLYIATLFLGSVIGEKFLAWVKHDDKSIHKIK